MYSGSPLIAAVRVGDGAWLKSRQVLPELRIGDTGLDRRRVIHQKAARRISQRLALQFSDQFSSNLLHQLRSLVGAGGFHEASDERMDRAPRIGKSRTARCSHL